MLARDVHDRLLARARALGLQGDGDEQLLDALLDREVPLPPPTEADCRRYFDQHPQLFRSGELVEADHILFAVTDRVPPAALRQRAQQVLEQALAAPERFAELAREFSNCPSAQAGGSLGQIARRDVVPEFWQAVATFAGGGVLPGLVESRYGLHVVRVRRRIEGRSVPYEQARPRIAAWLEERNLTQALREYALDLMPETGPDHPH